MKLLGVLALLATVGGLPVALQAQTAPPAATTAALPAVGKAAPAFRLPDPDGKPHTLDEHKGRSVALFFFCGCSWCWDVAKEWSQIQRGGALPPATGGSKAPTTVVVYSLSPENTRLMGEASGLDLTQTLFLPDPTLAVTKQQYDAEPCPRVFVLDPKGVIRYTNNSKEDQARKAPALAIVSRTLDALRAIPAAKPAAPTKPAKPTSKR